MKTCSSLRRQAWFASDEAKYQSPKLDTLKVIKRTAGLSFDRAGISTTQSRKGNSKQSERRKAAKLKTSSRSPVVGGPREPSVMRFTVFESRVPPREISVEKSHGKFRTLGKTTSSRHASTQGRDPKTTSKKSVKYEDFIRRAELVRELR